MLNHENIPELKIERMADQYGAFILLTQDNCGNSESVALHMIHLRFLAEQFGLVPTSDPDGARTIATLQRRIRLLRDRVDHLSRWLSSSERERTGIEYGVACADALAVMAAEFCEDMGGQA